jgi:hypothetical protein
MAKRRSFVLLDHSRVAAERCWMIFTLTLAAAGFAETGFTRCSGRSQWRSQLRFARLRRCWRDSPNRRKCVALFFFCSICLRTNFVTNFRLGMTLSLPCWPPFGKIPGATWGARLGGMGVRSSWAVGVAIYERTWSHGSDSRKPCASARPQGNLCSCRWVVVALVTSLISGPLTQALMKSKIGCEQESG